MLVPTLFLTISPFVRACASPAGVSPSRPDLWLPSTLRSEGWNKRMLWGQRQHWRCPSVRTLGPHVSVGPLLQRGTPSSTRPSAGGRAGPSPLGAQGGATWPLAQSGAFLLGFPGDHTPCPLLGGQVVSKLSRAGELTWPCRLSTRNLFLVSWFCGTSPLACCWHCFPGCRDMPRTGAVHCDVALVATRWSTLSERAALSAGDPCSAPQPTAFTSESEMAAPAPAIVFAFRWGGGEKDKLRKSTHVTSPPLLPRG